MVDGGQLSLHGDDDDQHALGGGGVAPYLCAVTD